MTAAEATALADLLDDDEVFEFVANALVDAEDSGGGLENVIASLRGFAVGAS